MYIWSRFYFILCKVISYKNYVIKDSWTNWKTSQYEKVESGMPGLPLEILDVI